ncbi:MAG TPA: stage II sporulation protein P [Clostridia bacterium]|nr:stage II sporulation protein P [Clostridia bacterium]
MQTNARAVRRKTNAKAKGWLAAALIGLCALILVVAAASKLAGASQNGDPDVEATPKPTLKLERADVDENVDIGFLMELIGTEEPKSPNMDLSGSEPKVLIYHTHTKESYFPTDQYDYEPGDDWRCQDDAMNVVAVGERLAEDLRNVYGIEVIHDTTDHEPPKLATAYARSLETMLYYKEKYPSVTLFIDLHRDSYGNPVIPSDYIVIDGHEVARIMFVVGTGKGATGTGFDEMPDFASNYALAKRLTEYLLRIDDGLARNIRVKAGRYNQHVSSTCLLAEVGHNGNTLEQALSAADYLAAAIANAAGLNAKRGQSVLPLTP